MCVKGDAYKFRYMVPMTLIGWAKVDSEVELCLQAFLAGVEMTSIQFFQRPDKHVYIHEPCELMGQ